MSVSVPFTKNLKIVGAGAASTFFRINGNSGKIQAEGIQFRDITFKFSASQGPLVLDGELVSVVNCKFERFSEQLDAQPMVEIRCSGAAGSGKVHWENNMMVSRWEGETITEKIVFEEVMKSLAPNHPELSTDWKRMLKLDPIEQKQKFHLFLQKISEELILLPQKTRERFSGKGGHEIFDLLSSASPEREKVEIGMMGILSQQATSGLGPCLGIANSKMGGTIRDSNFEGDIILFTDLTDTLFQGTKMVKDISGELNELVITGNSLDITGNRLNKIIQKIHSGRINSEGVLIQALDGYASLAVSENIFDGEGSSFIGENISMIGNQFRASGESEVTVGYIFGMRGVIVGNLANARDAVLYQVLPRFSSSGNLLQVK